VFASLKVHTWPPTVKGNRQSDQSWMLTSLHALYQHCYASVLTMPGRERFVIFPCQTKLKWIYNWNMVEMWLLLKF